MNTRIETPSANKLIFKCGKCGEVHSFDKKELTLDFDCVESSEREMGNENTYEATESFQCANEGCDNEINISFRVWEYPVGARNDHEVEIEDGEGELIECFDFTVEFESPESEDFDDENFVEEE